jgi:protein-S-isoprenylcysteine O-methyltransferase Ste14
MADARSWFARYRVRLGFAAAVLVFWLARPCTWSLVVGATVAMAGEAIRIWAAGHLEKGREVTVSGPYRFTRHPLYLGSAVIGIGFAIASASVAVAAFVAIYLVVTMTSAIRSEEQHLTEKFGSTYPSYKGGRAPQADRRFSIQRVIANREYRALTGLVLALALLVWKAR